VKLLNEVLIDKFLILTSFGGIIVDYCRLLNKIMNNLINDVNMSGDDSEEEQIELIPSRNTSIPTPTSSRKLKKRNFSY